jgi:hypothetical protein
VPNISQSSYMAFTILIGFIVFITCRGELGAYMAIFIGTGGAGVSASGSTANGGSQGFGTNFGASDPMASVFSGTGSGLGASGNTGWSTDLTSGSNLGGLLGASGSGGAGDILSAGASDGL